VRGGTRRGLIVGAVLCLALAACAQKEEILQGERLSVRSDLPAEAPADGQATPAETAAATPANRSAPISLPAQSNAADWTHRGANSRHLMPHAALRATPQRVWSVGIGEGSSRKNRISAAPVVAAGRVFTMDGGATVAATSTAGALLWSADLTADFDRGGGQSNGGLAVGGDRLFATTGYGELVALDVASGRVLWRQELDTLASGAPATDGNVVYVSGRDGSAWALAAADGKVIWRVAGTAGVTGYVGSAAPTISDRVVIFPSSGGELMAVLKVGNGTTVWRSSLAGRRLGRAYAFTPDITGDAVISGSTLFAGTASGRTVALDASSGKQVWSAGEGALGPVAVGGGSVFLVNDEARLVRLDAATGEVIWSVPMPYFADEKVKRRKAIYAHYGPVLAGGRVMVVSSDGLLRAFDPTDGSLTHTAEIPGGAATQPAVAGGTLFVVGTEGQLHAFR
jgi:outer membrane protein assembly factor BamB